jgi:hypothetical protein
MKSGATKLQGKYDRRFEPLMRALDGYLATLTTTGDYTGYKILNRKLASAMMAAALMLEEQRKDEGHC